MALALTVPRVSFAKPPVSISISELQKSADLILLVEFVRSRDIPDYQHGQIGQSIRQYDFFKSRCSTFTVKAIFKKLSSRQLEVDSEIDVNHLAFVKPRPRGGRLPPLVNFEEFLRTSDGKLRSPMLLLYLKEVSGGYEFACPPIHMADCVRVLFPLSNEVKHLLPDPADTWEDMFPEAKPKGTGVASEKPPGEPE